MISDTQKNGNDTEMNISTRRKYWSQGVRILILSLVGPNTFYLFSV